MSVRLKVALWTFVPSALVGLAYFGLGVAYPDVVGGTNIGGGAVLLLAYVGMVVGVGFFIAAVVEKKRRGHSSNG